MDNKFAGAFSLSHVSAAYCLM